MRAPRIALLPVVAGSLLAACGGSGDVKGPPGSESNPLVAVPNPSATRTPPVERPPGEGAARPQARSGGSSKARSGGSSKARRSSSSSSSRTQHGSLTKRPAAPDATAAAVMHGKSARKQKPVRPGASRPCSLVTKAQATAIVGAALVEPLQAPQGPTCIYQTTSGRPYITLAVQTVDFAKLRKQIGRTRAVPIANRTAYCGTYGEPTLFLPVTGGRVLTIAAPCNVARRFAATAAGHL